MMQSETIISQKHLKTSLYSGIALIVISILFLGREQEQMSFLARTLSAVVVPGLFYVLGGMVMRYLKAPLAGPGIIATGGWLIVVGLIHLWDQADMPDFVRPYYWWLASFAGAAVITMTAHRVRTWLLIPLVPLVQANALWAAFDMLGLNIIWWAAFTFLLVLAWWELPKHVTDDEWQLIYQGSGVLMTVFLLVFAYWLPAPTDRTMLTTWSAGALLVTYLGVRHRAAGLIPLALAMLTGSVLWGLPPAWWSAACLVIAIGTIVFIEYLARQSVATNRLAMNLSIALAILLTGFAALVARISPLFNVDVHPVLMVLVLFSSAGLLGWIGWRGSVSTAVHAALWLLASGWGTIYTFSGDEHMFGLWLSVLAVVALLVERLLTSLRKQKRKMLYSITETVLRWSLADLIIGLTLIIFIWAAMNIMVVPPLTMAITLLIVVGIWIGAGLVYRLPLLLHVALWIAPVPYALLLLVTVPGLRSASMMGLAWQILAVGCVLLGHIIPKYRPAMLAPFFVAGYALLGFGLTLTLVNPVLLLVSLALVIVVSFATSIAVYSDGHPAWSALVAWLIPPEEKPYAYKHVHNLFLFLTAWLMVIWLHLMLEFAGFAAARQGIILVMLSSVWIITGRLLPRMPGMVGWPVYGAGWFMWLVGLLQVFFAPTEAIVAAIIGLALSGEALHRSKEPHWMPVFVIQLMFSCLEAAWMLELPPGGFLLGVSAAFALLGMWQHPARWGQFTALIGGILVVAIALLRHDVPSMLVLLVLSSAALWRYRRWEWMIVVYASLIGMGFALQLHLDWQIWLILSGLQLGVGTYLAHRLRGGGYRTLETVMLKGDWGAPFLWFGLLSAGFTCLVAFRDAQGIADLSGMLLALAIFSAFPTMWWRVPRLPKLPVWLFIAALLLDVFSITGEPFGEIGSRLGWRATMMVGFAFAGKVMVIAATSGYRPFVGTRWLVWWLRPIKEATTFLAVLGFGIALVANLYQPPPYVPFIYSCLFLAGLCSLVFAHKRRVRWMFSALVFCLLAWANVLSVAHVSGVLWYSVPFGILLMVLARGVKEVEKNFGEAAGIGVLVLGSLSAMNNGINIPGAVSMAGITAALLVYGYVDGRRLPFFSAMTLILGGGLVNMLRVSPWLVPLLLGVGLITGVLILETQRQWVEGWYGNWRQRVSGWH